MSEYEQFIGVILLTAVVFVLIGLLLSAFVIMAICLYKLWRCNRE